MKSSLQSTNFFLKEISQCLSANSNNCSIMIKVITLFFLFLFKKTLALGVEAVRQSVCALQTYMKWTKKLLLHKVLSCKPSASELSRKLCGNRHSCSQKNRKIFFFSYFRHSLTRFDFFYYQLNVT